ncbi:MAG: O-methyltransferase [Clostridia bacterium]|nr:O-methyltransferase [Clostridia bacterium]
MFNEELLGNIKEEALKNHVPILQDESLDLILMILNIKKPNKILEIGTAVGYSAIHFSKYLDGENAKIKTIEINENSSKIAIENIKAMGLEEKIEVVNADATTYLETLEENTYDVVFIDAAKGQYLIFLKEAIRLIKSGGIIIADNVLFKGRVLSDYNEHKHRTATNRLRTYLKLIQEDERLNSTLVKIGDGVAISIVNK